MEWKLVTGIILIVGIVIWVAWDIVAASAGGPGATISEITLAFAKVAPILAVVLGVICGHLFGVFDGLKPTLLFLSAHPLLAFIWGVLTGVLFWNQGR